MSPRRGSVALALALAVHVTGCDWDLQRMVDQERCGPMERTRLLPGGFCDRSAPEGTVGHTPVVPEPHAPPALDRRSLERGREHFERFCAPCHGVLGNGQSPVAENMELRKPPALDDPDIASIPDQKIFEVITHGFGLMPAYAHVLEPRERWAVVAYVRALVLSQAVKLEELPASTRERAAPWLK